MRTALLLLLSVMLAAAKPPADTQARLDAFVKDKPGGIAIAWVDASGVAFFNAGKFSATDPRPITADTQFEIGSVTKVFTALLLAESERLEKMKRTDPAINYLLPVADPARVALEKITFLSLATHSSGLPRLPRDFAPGASSNPYARVNRADLVTSLRIEGPVAPVGRAVLYSNFGTAFLAEALATAWHQTYAQALREHVLQPLGMDTTIVGLTGTKPAANLAPGHRNGQRAENWEWDAYAGCGALRSTPHELAKFLQAALGGKEAPLHAAFVATTTPQRPVEKTDGFIGLNWFITGDKDPPIIWHNGATGGYHSFVGFTRASGAGVAVLTNHDASVDELGFSLLGGKPPQTPTAATLVKAAADFVGRYVLNPKSAIDITERDGVVFEQTTGQSPLRLNPIKPDRFAVVGVRAEISFERDAAGKVIALTLHQNGIEQRAKKTE